MATAHPGEMEVWQTIRGEHRAFTRVPFSHAIHWLDDNGEGGAASIRDVSRSGVRLSLGRFLRPGPCVRLVFDGIAFNGAQIEVRAVVVWCRPENSASDQFAAGFRIVQGERGTLGAMSEVFYTAIRQYAETHQFH